MTGILGGRGRRALGEALAARPLLAFDFDGTLAPLVDDPARARMRPDTRSLLVAVARRHPVAVISGRRRGDVARRLRGVRPFAVVGNHGAERSAVVDAALRARVRRWRDELRAPLAGLEGVVVEDKGLTLSVHYRRAPRPARARERVLRGCAALEGARVFGGHAVVNVAPAGLPRKSDALRELSAELGASHALYVGDDETDEEAFAADVPGLVSVRVGPTARSCARFSLPAQAATDELLRLLLLLP